MEHTPDYNVPPHLQRMIDAGVNGLDILHGELKNLMLIAEQDFEQATQAEEDSGFMDAMLSMERTRSEGILDTLVSLYTLTYQLSFAIAERESR
jgi:hypothetical protein